jgi:hypothetical protein
MVRFFCRNPPWAWLSAEIDYREKSDFVAMRKPVMCNCQIVPSMGVAKTKRKLAVLNSLAMRS